MTAVPFVYQNTETREYWMLLCAQDRGLRTPRRGCMGLATFADLLSWEAKPPLWSPALFWAPECPDYFEHDGWKYLIYSNVRTRYRAFHGWGRARFQ